MVAYYHLLCVLHTVTPGYVLVFSATEYEFDISVYSPVGTVVFEAFLFVESNNNFTSIGANFAGPETEYSPYSINGMNMPVSFAPIRRTRYSLTVALDEALDLNDEEAIYEFSIDAVGFFQGGSRELRADVIIHEIGKLAIATYCRQTYTCLLANI